MNITEEMQINARENGINNTTLKNRIKSGWNIEDAVSKPMKRKSRRYTGEYAVYKDDKIIAMGTVEECANELGVSIDYIKWMVTPFGQKRIANRKNPDKAMTAVKLDD